MKEDSVEKELSYLKMDKKSFSVASLTDPPDDRNYWFEKTPIERLKHMEILRKINYGHRAAARLQRLLEITER